MTTMPEVTSGAPRRALIARATTGAPPIGRNCFGTPSPARRPRPAATMMAATVIASEPLLPDLIRGGEAERNRLRAFGGEGGGLQFAANWLAIRQNGN